MKHIVDTDKTVDRAAEDLEEAVTRNRFGIMHVHDLKATMKSKGIDLPHECRIFEVCNPKQASIVLSNDMSLNMALPCRISIWEEGGKVRIGTLRPTALLSVLSDAEELKSVAEEVEETVKTIIEEAR